MRMQPLIPFVITIIFITCLGCSTTGSDTKYTAMDFWAEYYSKPKLCCPHCEKWHFMSEEEKDAPFEAIYRCGNCGKYYSKSDGIVAQEKLEKEMTRDFIMLNILSGR